MGSALIVCLPLWVAAQAPATPPPTDWHHRDETQDALRGVSSHRAYQELLKNRKPGRTVVVAVIDSGTDIDHEDLKDVRWTNPKEIADNGKDDDGNGYVDDVHGWNFIGGADGRNVAYDQLEMTREYKKYLAYFAGKDTTRLSADDQAKFDYYRTVRQAYTEKLAETQGAWANWEGIIPVYKASVAQLKAHLQTETLTPEAVQGITDASVGEAKNVYLQVAAYGITEQDMNDIEKYFTEQLNYNLNLDYEIRSIVGDDYANTAERTYGNADVIGPDADHGTHVAGIIAAGRQNGKGIDGLADAVRIMVVRAVPGGDERDKDVANAIRYAADNGAHIINMSFGKSFSPEKQVVDQAVAYAVKKGVLLVHAAGNDAKDLTQEANFPNADYLAGGQAETWIEVGASSFGNPEPFVADFSNYGKTRVDLLAPGDDIYSTIPGSTYTNHDGTSMAAPVVSGVAAVVMAYYPTLSAKEVKEILLASAVRYPERTVAAPGEEATTVPLTDLCRTGGIVNLYAALQAAEKRAQQSK